MADYSNIQNIIRDLGSNYHNDEQVINDIYSEVCSIASNISNLEPTDKRLFPYIKRATKAEYLSRGAEGLKSRNEGSISSSYEDIIEKLENDIIRAGLRRVF